MNKLELLLDASRYYQAVFRNQNLAPFVPHTTNDMTNWEKCHGLYDPGIYAIFSSDYELLYIGSCTGSINSRVKKALKRDFEGIAPAHIQVIEVRQDFEAASFEQFLIRRLSPRFNGTHNRGV